MPKRFTDTDKWKKPFIRGLEGPYKLLWFYILDDCNHAGVWEVDFEVARIRIGDQVDKENARKIFGDRIIELDKHKWFVPDFITFQYGELSEKNRLHQSVIQLLTKYSIPTQAPYRPPVGAQGQGTRQGIGQEQGKGDERPILKSKERPIPQQTEWENWANSIVEKNDPVWDGDKNARVVGREEMDAFLSVATRCDWKMDSQQKFRTTLKGFDLKKYDRGTNKKSPTGVGTFKGSDYATKF